MSKSQEFVISTIVCRFVSRLCRLFFWAMVKTQCILWQNIGVLKYLVSSVLLSEIGEINSERNAFHDNVDFCIAFIFAIVQNSANGIFVLLGGRGKKTGRTTLQNIYHKCKYYCNING